MIPLAMLYHQNQIPQIVNPKKWLIDNNFDITKYKINSMELLVDFIRFDWLDRM